MPDLINDWRSWTNQQEIGTSLAFPGMNAFTDAELISNTAPSALTVTSGTVASTTVTLTVPTTYTSESGAVEPLVVGQVCQVTTTGFTTNNLTNAIVTLTAVTATTVQFTVATNTPTGTASGGTLQPSEVFAAGTLGSVSLPTYDNSPTLRNAVDPFAGWTSQQALPASSFGSAFPLTVTGVSASGSAPNIVATLTVGSTAALRASATDPMYVTIAGVGGATQVNGTFPVATVVDATHFTIAMGSTTVSSYTSGGSVTYAPSEVPQVTGLTSDLTN